MAFYHVRAAGKKYIGPGVSEVFFTVHFDVLAAGVHRGRQVRHFTLIFGVALAAGCSLATASTGVW